jgi:hypothetical protein
VGPESYCREIETYLCRKNDGHLIRVVGPSFEIVSRWEATGVPLKVAFAGIDRYFERYYRKGPRRRPVRVEFCEADVLDVFDEWRRAVGLPGGAPSTIDGSVHEVARRRPSATSHLERAMVRLTSARVTGRLGQEADEIIERVSHELDEARRPGGVRGAARQALADRLAALDSALLQLAKDQLSEDQRLAVAREAAEQLASFRERMPAHEYARALDGAINRLVRERASLPFLEFL